MADAHRRNSFDLIRLAAACGVVVSHSYPLVGREAPSIGSMDLGHLSVVVFFVVSGYLVSGSWLSYPRAGIFLAKRVLRIYPGLAVALVSSILAVGFVSSLPYRTYIGHPGTIAYLDNLLLVNTRYELPGVFAHNAFPNTVNGSLWTLPYEFAMYLVIAAFGAFLLLRRPRSLVLWGTLLAVTLTLETPASRGFDRTVFFLSLRVFAQFGLLFWSGVVLQLYPGIRRRLGPAALLGLPLFVVGSTLVPRSTTLLAATALAVGLITLGHLPHFAFVGRFGDFSYGVYIYAFPVQQLIQHMTDTTSPYKMMAAALPISLVLGALSWHLVEAPGLRLKDRLRVDESPVPQRRRALAPPPPG